MPCFQRSWETAWSGVAAALANQMLLLLLLLLCTGTPSYNGCLLAGLRCGRLDLTWLDCTPLCAQVMDEREELCRAVAWLAANATFDVDARVGGWAAVVESGCLASGHCASYCWARNPTSFQSKHGHDTSNDLAQVHVFELTIRAVGGLLSAHMLIEQVGAGCWCASIVLWLTALVQTVCRNLADARARRCVSASAACGGHGCGAVSARSCMCKPDANCATACATKKRHRTPAWCLVTMAPCCAWRWTSQIASCRRLTHPLACRYPGSTCGGWVWGAGCL